MTVRASAEGRAGLFAFDDGQPQAVRPRIFSEILLLMQIAQILLLEYPRNLCKSHNLLTFTIYTPLGVYIVNTRPIYIIYYNFTRYYIYYIYIYLQVYNILYSFGLHPNICSFSVLISAYPASSALCLSFV